MELTYDEKTGALALYQDAVPTTPSHIFHSPVRTVDSVVEFLEFFELDYALQYSSMDGRKVCYIMCGHHTLKITTDGVELFTHQSFIDIFSRKYIS